MGQSPIRVFIAEDSPTVVAVVKALLAKTPDLLVVGSADSGQTVVDQVMRLKPDVVLMDIGLVGVDGITATRQLKEAIHGIKVIIVTANESDQLLFNAFAAGADAYYLKAAFNEQLVRAIRSVTSGAAWLHPAIASRVLQACVRGAEKLADTRRKRTTEHRSLVSISKHESLRDLVIVYRELEGEERLREAEAVLQAACALCEKLNGPVDPELATLLTMQADMFYTHEKFVQAESLYLRALEIRHQVLGYEHEDVARSLENLGNLYDTKSSYAEAEHYYFWSLKVREKVQGPGNPLSAETCAKLAWVYRAQGKLDLAADIEEKARAKSGKSVARSQT